MAFNIIRQTEDGVPVYECLSTDTKETPQPLGAVAYETDTGDEYEYLGSTVGWVNVGTNGSANVINGINGTMNTYVLLAEVTATRADAADNRIDTTTNDPIKAFKVEPLETIGSTTVIGVAWSADTADFTALDSKLDSMEVELATPTGTAYSNAFLMPITTGDATLGSQILPSDWVVIPGGAKTLLVGALGASISVQVKVIT